MAGELTEAWVLCPLLSSVFTRSGLCSCSLLMTGSLVSAGLQLSSAVACLGPRSRMSRTEKLDVFGILIDNNLGTESHSFLYNLHQSLLLNEIKSLGVLVKGRLLLVRHGSHIALGVGLRGDRLSGVGGRDPGSLTRHQA